MSRQTPAALLAKLANQSATLATCWKIELNNGVILGFTDHDTDIVYAGVTYQAATGFTRTAYEQKTGLSVDNMDIQGFFDSAAITEQDVIAGLYEDAKIWGFVLDYTDTGLGIHKLDYGYLGDLTIQDDLFLCEFRSVAQRLAQPTGEKYGSACRVAFGSAQCGVALMPGAWQASTVYKLGDIVTASSYDNRRYECTTEGTSNDTEGEPTWDTTIGNTTTETDGVAWLTLDGLTKSGTVTGVTSKKTFADTSRTEADGNWQHGTVTWLTGNNAGFAGDVKQSFTSGGEIYLRFDCPYSIQIGDTYTITGGCNHLLKAPGDVLGTTYTGDCVAKYNNAANFRGECEIPGNDKVMGGFQE